MGVKDWSPKMFKFMLVHGTIDDKLEDSDLAMDVAANEEEVDLMVDHLTGMGADVIFVFIKTDDSPIWDEERGKYVERPSWKLHSVR